MASDTACPSFRQKTNCNGFTAAMIVSFVETFVAVSVFKKLCNSQHRFKLFLAASLKINYHSVQRVISFFLNFRQYCPQNFYIIDKLQQFLCMHADLLSFQRVWKLSSYICQALYFSNCFPLSLGTFGLALIVP